MLRVHFTPQDLASVTLAPAISPMWEVLLSANQLQSSEGKRQFGQWRTDVRGAHMRRSVLALLTLCPPIGYSPDFLTPLGTSMTETRDRLADTDPDAIATQVSLMSPTPHNPEDARRRLVMLHDPVRALRAVLDAMSSYWECAIAPYWPAMQRQVAADLQLRSRIQSAGGVAALLQSVCPGAEWGTSVLSVPGLSGDLHLDGAGLLLQPSYFCWGAPTKLRDPSGRPVLVYPVEHHPAVLTAGSELLDRELGRLIGAARVDVLRAARTPGTTSEIADRLDVCVSSVSRHAGALARSRLIVSRRDGKSVSHSITELGMALLEGTPSGLATV